MIKIAVCDDNPDDINRLKGYIDKGFPSDVGFYDICCDTFQSGEELLERIKKQEYYDIILLDIVMKEENGIHVAEQIREYDKAAKIIFVTSSAEFALDAYEVKACGYIVKPPNEEKVKKLLAETIEEISAKKNTAVLVETRRGFSKIYIHTIECIEIMGHQLFFHLQNGEIVSIRGKLLEYENIILNDQRFIKPHRSYIVNMDCIYTINSKEMVLVSQTKIPIARSVASDVLQQYLNYSFSRSGGIL